MAGSGKGLRDQETEPVPLLALPSTGSRELSAARAARGLPIEGLSTYLTSSPYSKCKGSELGVWSQGAGFKS